MPQCTHDPRMDASVLTPLISFVIGQLVIGHSLGHWSFHFRSFHAGIGHTGVVPLGRFATGQIVVRFPLRFWEMTPWESTFCPVASKAIF